MVALCNRADHIYFHAVSSSSSSFFISSPNLSGRRLDVCHTSTHSVAYECRSEMCYTWLAENTGRKNDAKNRHLGTIPQLCRAISSQLRQVSTIGKKKLVKQRYLLHMSAQYGELRPTTGWDRFGSLGHPSYFQRLPRFGNVTERQSSSERQRNFAALNKGRHLCSAGRPSRWALAHISSFFIVHCV